VHESTVNLSNRASCCDTDWHMKNGTYVFTLRSSWAVLQMITVNCCSESWSHWKPEHRVQHDHALRLTLTISEAVRLLYLCKACILAFYAPPCMF